MFCTWWFLPRNAENGDSFTLNSGGRWVTNEDFKNYAPLFQDELTIDKMDRQTLDALCKIFKANPGN